MARRDSSTRDPASRRQPVDEPATEGLPLPRRTPGHILGEKAVEEFRRRLPAEWLPASLGAQDYGLDLLVQVFNDGRPTGAMFGVQVKGRARLRMTSEGLAFDVATQTINYLAQLPFPSVLSVWDESRQAMYARPIDELAVQRLRHEGSHVARPRRTTVHLRPHHRIDSPDDVVALAGTLAQPESRIDKLAARAMHERLRLLKRCVMAVTDAGGRIRLHDLLSSLAQGNSIPPSEREVRAMLAAEGKVLFTNQRGRLTLATPSWAAMSLLATALGNASIPLMFRLGWFATLDKKWCGRLLAHHVLANQLDASAFDSLAVDDRDLFFEIAENLMLLQPSACARLRGTRLHVEGQRDAGGKSSLKQELTFEDPVLGQAYRERLKQDTNWFELVVTPTGAHLVELKALGAEPDSGGSLLNLAAEEDDQAFSMGVRARGKSRTVRVLRVAATLSKPDMILFRVISSQPLTQFPELTIDGKPFVFAGGRGPTHGEPTGQTIAFQGRPGGGAMRLLVDGYIVMQAETGIGPSNPDFPSDLIDDMKRANIDPATVAVMALHRPLIRLPPTQDVIDALARRYERVVPNPMPPAGPRC